ncbi:MAG: hypothetical protein IKI11_01825 [Neisseriaceae bacterium]|nr:hypothetical protein [Neisseriaceae bacterium]
MEIEQITSNIQALYKEQKTDIVIAWLLNSCVAFLSGFRFGGVKLYSYC